MSKLEELKPNAAMRGILPDDLVSVVSVQWFGSEELELTCETSAGKVANELLYRHDEPWLEVMPQGRRAGTVDFTLTNPGAHDAAWNEESGPRDTVAIGDHL